LKTSAAYFRNVKKYKQKITFTQKTTLQQESIVSVRDVKLNPENRISVSETYSDFTPSANEI